MQETRRLRLQSAIQEELSQFVSREVKDPRIPIVTFTDVQVTQDGSHASVSVTILGGGLIDNDDPVAEKRANARMKDCLDGLSQASGFIRRHLARVLNVRHVPTLAFKEDKGLANSSRVHELLIKVQNESKPSSEGDAS